MIARDYTPLICLPVVIDAPGAYLTRCGERVNVTRVSSRNVFACVGAYPCGTPDEWHPSGRLFFSALCSNDIVSKAPAEVQP